MRAILRIFADDSKAVAKQFFAILIIIGISILPSFYAWVNIYASWDPYGNTGGVPVAVFTEDSGLRTEDGDFVNKARDVMDELKESDSIGWQFPKSRAAALEGVRSGEYYAAIVLEDNFTRNMYHPEEALSDEKAAITYYENQKKNAIANKITQSAMGNLQESINTQYLKTVFEKAFSETKTLSDEFGEEQDVDAAITELHRMRDTMKTYDDAIGAFLANNQRTADSLNQVKKDVAGSKAAGKKKLKKTKEQLSDAKRSVRAMEATLTGKLDQVGERLENLEEAVENISPNATEEKAILDVQDAIRILLAELRELRSLLPEDSTLPGVKLVINSLDSMTSRIRNLEELMDSLPGSKDDMLTVIQSVEELQDSGLAPGLKSMLKGLEDTVDSLPPLIKAVEGTLDDASPVLDSVGDTMDNVESTLVHLQKLLRHEDDVLKDIIEDVENSSDHDKVDVLIDRLGGDSSLYGDFFSSMVDTKQEEYYPVTSFGAAMAPFYTVLAIWIGGVILVAILKTEVDRKKYPGINNAQAFFGRYLIFFLVGQFQAGIIVLGDIFLLHCEPVHPWLMWIAASMASAMFVMFIYAMTLSFGPVGKAAVVVMMVVQIAGSSGSFPIELLPKVFENVYRFLPFPYGINALREALFGCYGHNYAFNMIGLLAFGVVALVVGLPLRRTFHGWCDFIEEKLAETEVL